MTNEQYQFLVDNQKRIEMRIMKLEMILISSVATKEQSKEAMRKAIEIEKEIQDSIAKSRIQIQQDRAVIFEERRKM